MKRLNVFAMIAGLFGGSHGSDKNNPYTNVSTPAGSKRESRSRNRAKHAPKRYLRRRGQRQKEGILTQIRNSNSTAHVNLLLTKGSFFEDASEETKRKWRKAADKRIAELTPSPEL